MDTDWQWLYRIGGVAALIATALFLSDLVVLIALPSPPETAEAWFALLESNRVVGILQLFFTDLLAVALMAPIGLALYSALRRADASYAAFAIVLMFIGIAALFASNANYSLLHLSEQYGGATTEAEKGRLLAAADDILATSAWGTGLLMAGLFLEAGMLILSTLMLRDTPFGRGLAYLGMAAHGLDLVHAIVFLVFSPVFSTTLALAIGTPLLAIGGTLQVIWYPLVGWKLLQIARLEQEGTVAQPPPTADPK